MLLTNDGDLARHLELPGTGWARRYRVRANGRTTQQILDRLQAGCEVDGIKYGPIDARLDREQGANMWLTLRLREGKNREIRNVLGALGLTVNRLIRISFGPFQLGDLKTGNVEEVKPQILKDQLGTALAGKFNIAASDAPVRKKQQRIKKTSERGGRQGRGKPGRKQRTGRIGTRAKPKI